MTPLQGLVRVERAERFDVDGPGTVRVQPELPTTVTIVNLSRTGCLFRGRAAPAVGATISIGIPGIGARPATVMRAASDGIGCAFLTMLSEREVRQAIGALDADKRSPASVVRQLRERVSQTVGEPAPQGWRKLLRRFRTPAVA